MGLKSNLFVLAMVIGALGAPLMVEAQLETGLLNRIQIQGIVFCTANGNIGINGTSTPTFPNATVQLQCGNGNIMSTTTTNDMGIFSIVLNPIKFVLSSILNNCNIVVKTPLSNCSAMLPSIGTLTAPLTFVGKTIDGIFSVMNVVPNAFQFLVPST